MLKMKNHCERCDAGLSLESSAFICSYECTFCPQCTLEMDHVCPNCSGQLTSRPLRENQVAETNTPAVWTETLSGACHCGAVQIELAHTPASLTECNCSICRRYGARWAYFKRTTARIAHAPGAVSSYCWNDREIEFFHCNHCGCLTHYEGIEKDPESRIAVNSRMLEAGQVSKLPIKYFDGAVSWKYLDVKAGPGSGF
jgi:hypothetical protein